ncbi:MAG: leucine--tRNA ligase [Phycisphaeraceae bacterium]|nr:MAG: leucine--tRNA ligase [Phycisphaeraceae bacterium]
MATETDTRNAHRYTAAMAGEIETRWQRWWDEHATFETPNPGDAGFDASRPKFYCLDMFPYPSGAGLHVGHPEGYTASDIVSRYKRMTGHNVLHPMGWDAFGLPAEQYAVQTGVHPAETTRKSIDTFRRQLKRFGFSYDWSREFGTIDEDYYKWTQWIFLKMYGAWFDTDADGGAGKGRPISELIDAFASGARPIRVNPDASEHSDDVKARTWDAWSAMDEDDQRLVLDSHRLTYLGEQTVNWCPKLGTALANEEVIDGKSERGGFPVLRKPLRQWMFRITAYADRLLAGLADVDWPDSTRIQQTEWIGRSEGAEIDFAIADAPAGHSQSLRVYTTRPDTLFGATYMVVAPEHPLVGAVLLDPRSTTDADAVREYAERARNLSDVERQESKEKTGVALGVDVVNPATGERIPVWVADYVLMGYGTGAIMAVPSGDERDFEFAKAFGLAIVDVVYPTPVLAMAYAVEHATEENAAGDWQELAADFIGLVTSENAGPDRFESIFGIVRTRRKTAGTESLTGRGGVQNEWKLAIEEIGEPDLASLRARFAGKRHWDASGSAFFGSGRAVNSANSEVSLDGLSVPEAKAKIIDWLESKGVGHRKVNYRLRDWLFSRQRYWGEPFPIVFDERGHHHPVGEGSLPVALPPMADYQPIESQDPKPLLAKATDWINTTAGAAGVAGLPADAKVTRESNTMPGWAGSCWYALRYCDAKNDERFVGRDAERYWMGEKGVDLYIGGAEHAVLHLLYARFWHKALYDLGEVSTPEPFAKLFHQGLITSFAFQRADKSLVPTDEVTNRGSEESPTWVEVATGQPVTQTTAKMSKSLKNVVNPDEVIEEYGADTFRLYEMYMGPLEASKPWNTKDTIGLFRFCQRLWRLCVDEDTGEIRFATAPDAAVEKKLHRTIDKVGRDIEKLGFNTAIAAMIEFVNAADALTEDQMDRFARTVAPFVPHLGEEIWHRMGRTESRGPASLAAWPEVDPKMLVDDEVEMPVSVGGKVRSKIVVAAGADAKAIEAQALADPKIAELLAGKTVRKVIVVPGRMVNIVAG